MPRVQHVFWVFFLILSAGVAGCGNGKIALYDVTGTVMVDSKAADGAMVIFVPTSTVAPEADRKRPFGIADAEGRFKLTTFVKDDGAPAGEYKVIIQWPSTSQQHADDARAGGRGSFGPDRLKGRYFNFEKSTLTAKVDATANELPPFALTSK